MFAFYRRLWFLLCFAYMNEILKSENNLNFKFEFSPTWQQRQQYKQQQQQQQQRKQQRQQQQQQ